MRCETNKGKKVKKKKSKKVKIKYLKYEKVQQTDHRSDCRPDLHRNIRVPLAEEPT
jgi:hypothetical protein